MNRWKLTAAVLAALAMPVFGQVAAENAPRDAAKADAAKQDAARLDAAKRAADEREAARRAVLELGGGIGLEGGGAPSSAPRQVEVLIEPTGAGGARSYRVGPPGAGGAPMSGFGGGGVAGGAARPIKKEKVPYLGVVTSSAPASIREQLKLGKGVGLVVDVVEAKTAAEAAGVKQHDVLEKLNDQLLINTEQFTAVLRSMKTGDEVTLSVLRQGERMPIKAKLGEKEVETGGEPLAVFNQPVPPPMAAMPPMLAGNDVFIVGGGVNDQPVTVWAANGAAGAGGMALPGRRVVEVRVQDGKQTTTWADGQYRINVERDNGNVSKVSVFDVNTGKVMFMGPPPAANDPALQAAPGLGEKIQSAIDAANIRPTPLGVLGGGDRGGGGGLVTGGPGIGGFVPAGRGKVIQWQDGDHILMLRVLANKPLYLLALSKKDGRTLYDGPVMTDEQRKSVPAEVSEQFELLSAHPEGAKEFGAKEGTAKEPAARDPIAPKEPTTPKPRAGDLPVVSDPKK